MNIKESNENEVIIRDEKIIRRKQQKLIIRNKITRETN